MEVELMQCPYNRYHLVKFTRFHRHISECRKVHPNKKMYRCVFNHYHMVLKENRLEHMKECPDAHFTNLLKPAQYNFTPLGPEQLSKCEYVDSAEMERRDKNKMHVALEKNIVNHDIIPNAEDSLTNKVGSWLTQQEEINSHFELIDVGNLAFDEVASAMNSLHGSAKIPGPTTRDPVQFYPDYSASNRQKPLIDETDVLDLDCSASLVSENIPIPESASINSMLNLDNVREHTNKYVDSTESNPAKVYGSGYASPTKHPMLNSSKILGSCSSATESYMKADKCRVQNYVCDSVSNLSFVSTSEVAKRPTLTKALKYPRSATLQSMMPSKYANSKVDVVSFTSDTNDDFHSSYDTLSKVGSVVAADDDAPQLTQSKNVRNNLVQFSSYQSDDCNDSVSNLSFVSASEIARRPTLINKEVPKHPTSAASQSTVPIRTPADKMSNNRPKHLGAVADVGKGYVSQFTQSKNDEISLVELSSYQSDDCNDSVSNLSFVSTSEVAKRPTLTKALKYPRSATLQSMTPSKYANSKVDVVSFTSDTNDDFHSSYDTLSKVGSVVAADDDASQLTQSKNVRNNLVQFISYQSDDCNDSVSNLSFVSASEVARRPTLINKEVPKHPTSAASQSTVPIRTPADKMSNNRPKHLGAVADVGKGYVLQFTQSKNDEISLVELNGYQSDDCNDSVSNFSFVSTSEVASRPALRQMVNESTSPISRTTTTDGKSICRMNNLKTDGKSNAPEGSVISGMTDADGPPSSNVSLRSSDSRSAGRGRRIPSTNLSESFSNWFRAPNQTKSLIDEELERGKRCTLDEAHMHFCDMSIFRKPIMCNAATNTDIVGPLPHGRERSTNLDSNGTRSFKSFGRGIAVSNR